MKIQNKKQGYALVTVISIMSVMAITFSMLMNAGTQSAHTGRLLKDRTKATAYAEAGIEYAYAILRDNFDARDNLTSFLIDTNISTIVSNSVEVTYGEGSYTLRFTELNDGQFVIINSVGKCRKSTTEVEAAIEDSNFSTGSGFDNAIFCGGGDGTKPSKLAGGLVIDSSGAPQTIHVNGDIDLKGGGTFDANISATGAVGGNNPPATGDVLENQRHVSMPSLEDQYEMSFADFEAQADEKISGDYIMNGSHTVSGDGIMYVDGNVTIKGDFVGTIIATGSITIQAGGSIIGTNNGDNDSAINIAVATQTGPIEYGTTDHSEGLFFAAGGDFKMTAAQADLEGQIVVNGIFEATGGSGITFVGAPEEEDLGANPVIAGWQK